MIIVEMTRDIQLTKFSNYAGFVYFSVINLITQADFWTDVFGAPDETSIERIYVSSFYRGALGENYDQVDSLNDCVDTEKSFFWDNDEQTIYVHFEHDQSWYTDDYYYGRAYGYTDKDVLYIDDTEYLPLIESVPSIAQQEDIQGYKSLAFVSGTIVLDNTGGNLDWMVDESTIGDDLYLYYIDNNDIVDGSATRSDMVPLNAFYIENESVGLNKNTLTVQDVRKAQNISIPVDSFTIDNYPDLDEKYINKPIPLIYGDIQECEAIPLDSESTGNVEFRLAKTLTALGQVQIHSGDVWTDVSTVSEDLSGGTFVLAYADCRKSGASAGDVLKCQVLTSTGEAITYASDVIKLLNLEALNITYNNSNYDTIEWEIEELLLSAVGVVFVKSIKLFEAIRQIQAGANIGFRYEIKPDGRRTIRVDNKQRAIAYTVDPTENKSPLDMEIESNPEYLAAIAEVQYKKNNGDNTYRIEIDDSRKTAVEKAYKQSPTLPIETLLQTQAIAQERATNDLENFSTIPKVLNLKLLGERWYGLRIYDILKIAITSGDVDFDSGIITGREFFGIWKAKVIFIDPDFSEIGVKCNLMLVDKIYPLLTIYESGTYDVLEIHESGTYDILEIAEYRG